uniref:MARVEL domain-containing protein n=1 Tax=Heterorhabditis bacteriophora TaxID=37862 RepID=A0A1I7X3A4_HETBA
MSMYDLKNLPHIVKPVALVSILILLIFQALFMFIEESDPFGWFVMLTTIVQLIVCVFAFSVFALDVPLFVTAPIWPVAEMTYSGVFTICEIINAVYFLINFFGNFGREWLLLLLSLAVCVLLALVWAFNTLQIYKIHSTRFSSRNQPTAPSTGHYPSHPTGESFNTAGGYPGGANPA